MYFWRTLCWLASNVLPSGPIARTSPARVVVPARGIRMDPISVLGTGLAFAGVIGMARWSPFGRHRESDPRIPLEAHSDLSVHTRSRQQPRLQSFLSLGPRGFHRVAYTEWGDANNPHLVICVHGFTRNSRDFDVLAARLADRCRVVCMDVVGRGASDWLERADDYDYSLYLSDAAALIARLTAGPRDSGNGGPHPAASTAPIIDWIGTSMGGLIGMLLAAKPNSPIRRMVLNDVGPLVPWPALTRLRNLHLPLEKRFKSREQVESHLREIYATFGPLDDAGWKHVALHSAQQLHDGDYVLAYDPGVMSGMNHARKGIEFGHNFLSGVDLWPTWDRVRSPTLVLRGGESDVLLPSVLQDMERRGPTTRIIEFPGIGHAPWLMAEEQIGPVREFLLAASP